MRPTIFPTGYWGRACEERHDWSPALAEWIGQHLKGTEEVPVYDLGCGMGSYVNYLERIGFRALGFEGDPPNNAHSSKIIQHDLTVPIVVTQPGNVIFLEVAEHVPAQFEDALLTNVTNVCSDKLVMSWAVRGQRGDGHVNCLNNDEAIERMTHRGFTFLPEETASSREAVKDCALAFFRNTLLIFRR
jgi:hypothetical protein